MQIGVACIADQANKSGSLFEVPADSTVQTAIDRSVDSGTVSAGRLEEKQGRYFRQNYQVERSAQRWRPGRDLSANHG